MTAILRDVEPADWPAAPDVQDLTVVLPGQFVLESGESLRRPALRVRVHGAGDGPAFLVLGGVSSDRGLLDCGEERGWWRGALGRANEIAAGRRRLIGVDFLPGPDEAPCTLTTRDQACAIAYALHAIGCRRLEGVIGASYGGMVALALAAAFPDIARRALVISAAHRAHPAATALRGVQRRVIQFAERCGEPETGVALARQLAMTAYRTPEEFGERFRGAPGGGVGAPYDVCDYLIARGAAFEMSAARYLTLSDSIDRHAVDPATVTAAASLVCVGNDRTTPRSDMLDLAERLPNLRRFEEFSSVYGHDAFLKEEGRIAAILAQFFQGDLKHA